MRGKWRYDMKTVKKNSSTYHCLCQWNIENWCISFNCSPFGRTCVYIRGVWLDGERQCMLMCDVRGYTLKPLMESVLPFSFGAEKSSPETLLLHRLRRLSVLRNTLESSQKWCPIFTYIDSYYTNKSSVDARPRHRTHGMWWKRS